MKLLESYSRSTSVEIKHKPVIYEKFFPLGELSKYITIQNSSGMPAKNYSWYSEVLELLIPILNKEGIKIIQLGDKDSQQLNGVIDLRGQTSLAQSYFILKRALLHIGNDSWIIHAACAEGIPCVSLYGSTTISNHSPYHYNQEKSIFLESDRSGYKASFSREEVPKMIDRLKPEEIAKSVCKLLNLQFCYEFNTIHIGNLFHAKMLESAVTDIVEVKKLGAQNLIMRMDINFNLLILNKQLILNPCQIITDKEIPISILNQFKNNVLGIIYKIGTNHNPNFIKELIENKIKYQLITELSTEKINSIKLEYMDYGIITQINNTIPKQLKDKDLSKIFFKTSKLLLANRKFYSSYYEYINNNPILNPSKPMPHQLNENNINILWSESENCIFLEKN